MITARDYKWMLWATQGGKIFSTCARKQYMCIMVDKHGHVVGTGYNGVPKGFPHCADGGCPRNVSDSAPGTPYGNCLAIHAEANALLHSDYAARVEGVTLYINGPPCWDCAKLISNAGVTRIVYIPDPSYADWPRAEGLLEQAGIICEQIHPDEL